MSHRESSCLGYEFFCNQQIKRNENLGLSLESPAQKTLHILYSFPKDRFLFLLGNLIITSHYTRIISPFPTSLLLTSLFQSATTLFSGFLINALTLIIALHMVSPLAPFTSSQTIISRRHYPFPWYGNRGSLRFNDFPGPKASRKSSSFALELWRQVQWPFPHST